MLHVINQIHTLRVQDAHDAANLKLGLLRYAKVARVHYLCTIALRTTTRERSVWCIHARGGLINFLILLVITKIFQTY